jgi:hypothetical protein
MKPYHRTHTQRGFFDLGIGLVLLAVFGATAVVVNSEGEKEPQQEVASYSNTVQD